MTDIYTPANPIVARTRVEQAIADGILYNFSKIFTITALGTLEFRIVTPTIPIGFSLSVIVSANLEVEVFEGATFSGNGNAETLRNANRVVGDSANTVLGSAATNSATGTLLPEYAIIGGDRNKAFGGSLEEGTGGVLKGSNEEYLVLLTDTSNGENIVTVIMTFVEFLA